MDVSPHCNCIMQTTNISASAESTAPVEIDVTRLQRTGPGSTSVQESRRSVSKCDERPLCASGVRYREEEEEEVEEEEIHGPWVFQRAEPKAYILQITSSRWPWLGRVLVWPACARNERLWFSARVTDVMSVLSLVSDNQLFHGLILN